MGDPEGDAAHEEEDAGNDLIRFVAAARAGEQAAWDELVDRFTPLLIGVLLRYRLTHAEREDVAQTTWLRLVEHLAQLREARALPMWIVTTARREALRALAARGQVFPHDPQSQVWSEHPAVTVDPDADLVRAERHEALLAGLTELNPRQRELLLLLAEDPPVPYADISDRLGIPVGAIGPTRARALQRLRRTPSVRALATERVPTGGGRTS